MKTWRQYEFGPFMLGTVQLGLPYGVANTIGQPDTKQSAQILQTAWQQGIRSFDTAQDYGTSEEIIGRSLTQAEQAEAALIITKLPQKCFAGSAELLSALQSSLQKLGRQQIFGVLAHSADVLHNTQVSTRLFAELKDKGYVQHTGISVYTVEEAEQALKLDHFDLIQIPLNALDRRPLNANLIAKAQECDKLLMFRSAYLQGLLLMNPHNGLPTKLDFARPVLQQWWSACAQIKQSPRQVALMIADHLAGPFPLVIGAESVAQVVENVTNIKKSLPQLPELLSLTESISRSCPERLLNPSLW